MLTDWRIESYIQQTISVLSAMFWLMFYIARGSTNEIFVWIALIFYILSLIQSFIRVFKND
jgi:hypothetical protein